MSGEMQLRIECKACRRICIMSPEKVTPFEYHRLKCSHCGARDPIVTEHVAHAPFTPGYRPRVFWFDPKK